MKDTFGVPEQFAAVRICTELYDRQLCRYEILGLRRSADLRGVSLRLAFEIVSAPDSENPMVAGKACQSIYQFPSMWEGSTESAFHGGIVLHRQRNREQRFGHSQIDGGKSFEAIYSIPGKERTVTEFWCEHTSGLQRQIYPSASMDIPLWVDHP